VPGCRADDISAAVDDDERRGDPGVQEAGPPAERMNLGPAARNVAQRNEAPGVQLVARIGGRDRPGEAGEFGLGRISHAHRASARGHLEQDAGFRHIGFSSGRRATLSLIDRHVRHRLSASGSARC
jgi:hypothetical protein